MTSLQVARGSIGLVILGHFGRARYFELFWPPLAFARARWTPLAFVCANWNPLAFARARWTPLAFVCAH